jgi:hypothetical protein
MGSKLVRDDEERERWISVEKYRKHFGQAVFETGKRVTGYILLGTYNLVSDTILQVILMK